MKNRTLQSYFLLVLLLGSLALAYCIFSAFLVPFVLAAVFAVVLQPLLRWVSSFAPNRSLASGLTLIISIVCILVPLGFLGVLITGEAQRLYLSLLNGTGEAYLFVALQNAQQSVHAHVPQVVFPTNLYTYIDQYARAALGWIVANLGVIFSSVALVLVNLFLFAITLFYLLRDGPAFKQAIIKLSPLDDRDDEAIFQRLERAVNSTIRGNLLTAFIQGVVAWLGFALFGVPNSILWALLASLASLIPGIGTLLVVLPAAGFLFFTGSTNEALGLLVWGVVFVSSIDNFIRPRLVGGGLQMHPLIVLLSVLGGLSFFGPLGLVLGPLCISLLFAVLAIHSRTNGKKTPQKKRARDIPKA